MARLRKLAEGAIEQTQRCSGGSCLGRGDCCLRAVLREAEKMGGRGACIVGKQVGPTAEREIYSKWVPRAVLREDGRERYIASGSHGSGGVGQPPMCAAGTIEWSRGARSHAGRAVHACVGQPGHSGARHVVAAAGERAHASEASEQGLGKLARWAGAAACARGQHAGGRAQSRARNARWLGRGAGRVGWAGARS
jgi:hypothetical protein